MSEKPRNIFEDIFGKAGLDLGDIFSPKPRIVICQVCNAKNRLKPGGSFPKCGRCKTRLT